MLTLLDDLFDIVGVIDDYTSLVWSERYIKLGEYEVSIPAKDRYVDMLESSMFMISDLSDDGMMIIGDIYYKYDAEAGSNIVVRGYSIEDILDWRSTLQSVEYLIVNVRDTIISLLEDHFITPAIGDRTFPGLSIDTGLAGDTDFDGINYSGNFDATSVKEIIDQMCIEHDIGYKISFDKTTRGLVFNLVKGQDRSYDQSTNPYVVFSAEMYNNVLSSEYFVSGADYRNLCVCNYEPDDPGVNSYWSIPPTTRTDGYFRREVTLITDLVVQSPPGTILPGEATSFLKDHKKISIFDGELDVDAPFRYKTDFFLGDILQCVFSGKNTTGRLVEIVYSIDQDGIKTSAAFDFE